MPSARDGAHDAAPDGARSRPHLRVGPREVRLALRRWVQALALRPLLWSLPFVVLGCVLGRAWAEAMRAASQDDAIVLAPALLGPISVAVKYLTARHSSSRRASSRTVRWSALWLAGACLLGLMSAHAARRWTPASDDVSRLLAARMNRLQPLRPLSGRVVARVVEVHRGEASDFAILELVPSPGTSLQLSRARGRVWAELKHPDFRRARSSRSRFAPSRAPQVLAGPGSRQVRAGDWVRARIELREPHAPGSPAEPDERTFALIRGAWCEGEVKGLEAASPPRAGWAAGEINGLLDAARSRIAARFERGFAQLKVPYARQSALLATAMAFGEGGLPEPLPAETRQAFKRAGVSHVLVASGAQVAIVCALLWSVARLLCAPIRHPAWRSALVALMIVPTLLFYALLVGGAASIWRATAIGIGALCVQARGRRTDALSLWCGALSLLLLCDPASLYDLSLQLSFGAAWGLIAFSRAAQSFVLDPIRALQPRPEPEPEPKVEAAPHAENSLAARLKQRALSPGEWKRGLHRLAWTAARGLSGVAGVSVAAHAGTLPVLLYAFGTLSLGSLCANLPIVPLSALLVGSGGASLLLPLPWIDRFNYVLTDGAARIVGVVAGWRSAWIQVPALPLAWTLLLGALALLAAGAAWWPALLFEHRALGALAHEDEEEAAAEHDGPRQPASTERALLWRATAQATAQAARAAAEAVAGARPRGLS